MGSTMHFYIIFGTNLLTEGPAQIAIFCLFQCFAEKEYQTKWNLRESYFWNKRNPGDLEWRSRKQQGGYEVGRRAQGGRHAPHPRGPLVAPPTYFFCLYILLYHENIKWEPRNHFSTAATFCTREIPSWGLFRRFAGGVVDHEGLLHQQHSLSDDVWVVYHRPSGP